MNDTKNENIEEVAVTEEVLKDALAEDTLEATSEENDGEKIIYTDKDGGLSGLTEKQRRRKEIFDKITTGLLIFLLCSPLIIILYILIWFFLR